MSSPPSQTASAPQAAAAASSPPSQTAPAPQAAAAASSPPARATSSSPLSTSSSHARNFRPAEHWLQTPVAEPNPEDNDSAYGGDDAASSTASLTSSILEYRTVNGRRYHSDRGQANYWGANDERANEALDMHHHLMLLCHDNELALAPISKDVQNVLDVGTGTGVWAIDFADEHPGAEVIGTDVSPIQPTWVPPNVKFEIEDCTQPWTFCDNTFDYVHIRYLVGSIADWRFLLSEAYRVCKPGGWIETGEETPHIGSDDGSLKPTHALSEWGKIFVEFGEKVGHPMEVVVDKLQEKYLAEAGCDEIGIREVKIPLGPWPKDEHLKEIGRFANATYGGDLEGFVTLPANLVLGWGPEQVTAYCAHVRNELKNRRIHAYTVSKTVWGRKPLRA